jgi:O-antigen/teichoic acid export membrane protein
LDIKVLIKNLVNKSIQGNSLRANFLWAFWGNAVNGLCQWGILIVLARLGVPETVGKFTLGLAITAPIMMLAHLDTGKLQATDSKDEFLFQHYYGLVLLNTIIALLVITVLIFLLGYRGETAIIIFLVALFKAAENISFVFYGLFQQREKMKYVASSLFIKAPVSLAVIAIVLKITGSLMISVLCFSFVWIITIFLYDMKAAQNTLKSKREGNDKLFIASENNAHLLQPVFSKAHLISLTALALPLGISLTISSLSVNLPRYFIEHNIGLYELGIFSAISYLTVIGGRFIVTLSQSLSPRLAIYYANNNHAQFISLLKKQCFIVLAIGLSGILLAFFFGRPFLNLLYGQVYAGYTNLFFWVMVYAAIEYLSSLLRNVLIIARLTRTEMIYRLLSLVGLVIMCIMLIPRLALLGAVYAQLISTLIYFAGCMITVFYVTRTLMRQGH